tara:strand:+ start:165 stop:296 length:132 start_codon:yes stop_codon:yes gene_type:complete
MEESLPTKNKKEKIKMEILIMTFNLIRIVTVPTLVVAFNFLTK